MAALTLYEASKLSRNPLAKGVMLAVATADEMIGQVPMVPTQGESFVYNREKALPSAEFVAPDHTSLTESAATYDRVTVPIRLIVTDVDVMLFSELQQGDTNAQTATQLEKKLKAVGRKISDKAITGAYVTSATISGSGVSPGAALSAVVAGPGQDSDRHGPGDIKYTHVGTLWQYRAPGDRTFGPAVAVAANATTTLFSDSPSRWITATVAVALATADGECNISFASSSNEPDGMKKLISSAQTISSSGANGDALSLNLLDQMIDKVKVRDNLRFVMNAALIRKFFALVRSLGAAGIEMVQMPGVVGSVPAYRGIPILKNDWITSDEAKGTATTLSSIFLVSFSEDGFHARVGQTGGTINVEADPRAVPVMGLRVRDVGELEGKEARRTRVSWYGAFALGSDLAACRAKEIITA